MKAVIFDLDGTVLDTLDDLADSLNAALTVCGYPRRTLIEVRSFVGNGIGKLVERALESCSTDEAEKERVLTAFTAIYAEHLADKTKPYEGICELLRALRKNGIATAVFSNKVDFAVKELGDRYFPGLFDLCRGEIKGVPRKPEPDGLFGILRELSVTAEEVLYIGDSEVDMQTAQNAGVAVIGVTWGFRSEDCLRKAGAGRIVRTVEELARELGLG